MPGLSFLSKKSWHTSNLNNQEKVWLAEQQAANEDRKLAELQEQIKVEREREEFEKLTNKNVIGDRGTNWMYEGQHGGGGEDGEGTTRKDEEAMRMNEAYLLGKEYVPEGKSGHTGDFVEAATMTGALEKASTYGAFSTDNSNNNNGGGGDQNRHYRIHNQEDDTTSSEAVVAANQEVQKEKDWSKEFHLRHEDPMFAVHQRRQAQLREVEKKKRLMQRAGLDVSVVTKRRENEGIDDRQRKNEASQPDDYDDDNRRRDRKRRSTDEKKKRRKRSSRNEEKKHHRHSKSKRDHRTRDRSLSSSSPSYSSSSSSTSSGYRRRRRDREMDDRRSRRSEKVDDRNCRRRERSRSRSSDNRQTIRRRDSEKKDNDYYYDNDRRKYYNDQKEDGQRRTQHRHYDSRNNDEDSWGRRDDCKPTSHNSNNSTRGKAGEDIRGRYGLVGTSLSSTNSNNGNMTKHKVEHQGRNSSTYLGPDRNLIESKRRIENEERERLRQLSHKGHRR
jgi:hypothetical protein